MENLKAKIQETSAFIKERTRLNPRIGIILGTGLGALVDDIEIERVIPYQEIPNFPVSTVESHQGNLVLGNLSGKAVVAMQGRFHYYEGYTMQQITFPVRVMKALGIEVLIISNAAGGMNRNMKKGDLMIITDHINLLGDNPLRGPNDPELGPRFPDMSQAYDKELRELALNIAIEKGFYVHQGVYVALPGPNLETPAEYRFLITIGADAVGMSTVPEVIVARHAGIRVFGISCITDLAIDGVVEPVNFEEIVEAANQAEPKLTTIIKELVARIQL
ncbi:purine-nucleoside phosphorylase [Thermatribacter velox]|uniref:Purine nucleoside phosphorylase n=1 Tax=Thermatribacter velox TaxID=3039681 RepID=A0ABZ2YDW5_9BACT